jgi:hypothetical protein
MASMSPSPLPLKPTDFVVAINTKMSPGFGHLVRVTITEDVVPAFDGELLDVNLADHPLYPYLQEYVKANPR